MLRRLATTTTILLAAVALAAPAGAARTAARTPQVRITGTNAAFSPNHDGSKDVGVVRYGLTGRADVTVQVSNRSGTVLLQHVGRVAAGTHYFRWNGTRNGRVVADGSYGVSVLARRTKRATPWVARTPLTVDARYTIGPNTLRLSSSTVYPRTTVINDAVVGNVLPRDAASAPIQHEGDPGYYSTARLQVRDLRGHVIDTGIVKELVNRDDPPEYGASRLSCANGCGRFTWDGRRSDGQVAAVGRYRIRVVRGVDPAGNPRILAPDVSVSVSGQRLIARTESRTLTAAGADRLDSTPGCLSCRDVVGSPSRSTRYPEGVSYDSAGRICPVPTGTQPCPITDRLVIPLTGRRTPSDRISVTATGGPPTAGGTGSVTLSAGGDDRRRSAQMQGDDTAVVADASFATGSEVPLTGRPSGLQWGVYAADGLVYDMAHFDVTWTTYVLP